MELRAIYLFFFFIFWSRLAFFHSSFSCISFPLLVCLKETTDALAKPFAETLHRRNVFPGYLLLSFLRIIFLSVAKCLCTTAYLSLVVPSCNSGIHTTTGKRQMVFTELHYMFWVEIWVHTYVKRNNNYGSLSLPFRIFTKHANGERLTVLNDQ